MMTKLSEKLDNINSNIYLQPYKVNIFSTVVNKLLKLVNNGTEQIGTKMS